MQSSVLPSGAKRLDELITYHFEIGGARTRATLALLSARALALPDSSCVALATSCELIHNASLLHDDIQDQDEQRRSRPAAWRRFDVNTAMCAGTLLLSAAYRILTTMPSCSAALITHTHQRTTNLIAGQVLDLTTATNTVDMNLYLEIATGKSGSLLALPLELALIAAGELASVPTATSAGHAFACAYQIIDDVADLETDLEQQRNNVVSVLMRTGIEREIATEMALELAHENLEHALKHALSLPANSGEPLVQLCDRVRLCAQTGRQTA